MSEKREYDLQERLIDFAVRTLNLVEALPNSRIGTHVANQLMRSGTSPAPNYGEAQAAESRADFVHKMKICLKELRETKVWLQIAQRKELMQPISRLDNILAECEELISALYTGIRTAEAKLRKRTRKTDT